MTASHLSDRRWTAAEERRLVQLVSTHHSYAVIARHLNRSESAVWNRLARLRTCLSDPDHGVWSLNRVAHTLGTGWKAVDSWIRHGWLTVYRALPGRMLVEEESVMRFLEEPEHWPCWDVASIREPLLREWATELRQGVEFLSVAEAAERLVIAPATVRKWVESGELRAVKNQRGYRVIRADWLADAPVPGRRRNAYIFRGLYDAEEVAFLRDWRPVQPLAYLAAALDRPHSSVTDKCQRLGLSGPIIPAAENLGRFARAS